jgi:hypothetical protein
VLVYVCNAGCFLLCVMCSWAHKQGYTLELYSLMEVQQFSNHLMMAISVETCSAPAMWKITLKLKKKIYMNFYDLNASLHETEHEKWTTGCCRTTLWNRSNWWQSAPVPLCP